MTLIWTFEVDWDNDGNYTNEVSELFDVTTRRGRKLPLRADGKGLEEVQSGQLIAKLNNLDRRYDPYYASSPLYPNVLPGARCRLRVTHNSLTYDVLTGYLSNIRPTGEAVERVQIDAEDGRDFLKRASSRTSLQTGIQIDQAIDQVLVDIDWPDGASLDAFSDTMAYWWAAGASAWYEINQLVDASLGKFFIAADGQAKYYSRLVNRSVRQTLTEDDIQLGVALRQPWEVIKNDISLLVKTRTLQATAELWRLGDKPLVEAGGSLTVWASFSYSNQSAPATNVISPVATTDYLMNSQADGGGSNLTANFSVAATIFGDAVKLVITNLGAVDGYVTLLKVRGDALTTQAVTMNSQDATSITRYKKRSLAIESNWLQSIDTATDLLSYILNFYKDALKFPVVTLRNQPVLQFGPDLFDFQALDFPSKDIDGNFVTGYIEHKWLERTGNLVETTFYFEPDPAATPGVWFFPAILDSSTFGA